MEQTPLFFEDVYEAIKTDVMALGGAKAVGLILWPEKKEKAGDYLNTCLNRARPEKLDPEQVELIIKLAKEAGSYATRYFQCDNTGFTRPTPIEPEDERAKLERDFIEAVKHLDGIKKQLEKNTLRAVG